MKKRGFFRRAGVAMLALTLPACPKKQPTAEEILAPEQKNLEPVAAGIERVAKQAQNLPAPTGKITLEGPPLQIIWRGGDDPPGNAAFAFDKDLLDLAWYARVDLRNSSSTQLANDCFMLARKKSMAGIHAWNMDRDPMLSSDEGPQTKSAIDSCKKLRYLVVIDLVAFKSTKYIDKETFGGGHASGNVLVFDLVTGKFQGGVPFKAQSSKFTKASPDDDLSANFYGAIKDAVVAVLPNAKL